MSARLELADESSSNGTGTLYTCLLVSPHPVGQRPRRNLAGKPCRQGPSTLCGSHICLRVSPPTARVLSPEGCTSISHRLAFSCTGRHRRAGTGRTDGLLFSLLPAPQEFPLSGGIRQYAAPTSEPGARRKGPKAFPLPWERLSPRPGLDALPESIAPWQVQCPR